MSITLPYLKELLNISPRSQCIIANMHYSMDVVYVLSFEKIFPSQINIHRKSSGGGGDGGRTSRRDAAVSLNVDYFSMLEKRARKIQPRASIPCAHDTQSAMHRCELFKNKWDGIKQRNIEAAI